MEISRQIHDFLTWKQVECPFEKDKKIQTYLLTSPIYTEEGKCALILDLLGIHLAFELVEMDKN